MIIGRQDELNQLETAYHAKEPQAVYISGESSVGKTALVYEFLSNHRNSFYFSACNSSISMNHSLFINELQAQGFFTDCNPSVCDDTFSILLKKTRKDQILIVLDDAQYAPQLAEELQRRLIEWKAAHDFPIRLLLIISGNMSEEMLATLQKSGNGIASRHISLSALTYLKAMPYYSSFDDEEKVLLYGITGGLPGCLNLIDKTKSFKDNLYSMFFSDISPLLDECGKYVEKQFRQPGIYHAILYAIASGKVRLGEISIAVGLEYNKLSKYIGSLLNCGLIDRIIPANEQHLKKQHKKTFYSIRNNMLLFWYRFVFPVRSAIRMGLGKKLMRMGHLSNIDSYAQKVFFEICRQYCLTLRQSGKFFLDFQSIGYFWEKEPSPDNLYLMASAHNQTCLMQCLWDKQKIHVRHLHSLTKEGIETGSEKFFVFSRKGFTSSALQYSAKHPNVWLLSLYYMK